MARRLILGCAFSVFHLFGLAAVLGIAARLGKIRILAVNHLVLWAMWELPWQGIVGLPPRFIRFNGSFLKVGISAAMP